MDVYCRLLTLSERFLSVADVEEFLLKMAQHFGWTVLGRVSNDDRGTPAAIPNGGLSKCLTADGDLGEGLYLGQPGVPNLEVNVLWHPPDFIDALSAPRSRLDMGLSVLDDSKMSFVEEVFQWAIEYTSPYWGELNDCNITGKYTFCNLEGHRYCVPHFGMGNYFRREYVEFFGGVERFQQAGFRRVERLHEGLWVVLPKAEDKAEFLKCRGEVESKLAPAEVFSSDTEGPLPRLAEWKDSATGTIPVDWDVISEAIGMVSNGERVPDCIDIEIEILPDSPTDGGDSGDRHEQ